jgi:hypothetical protein
MSTDKPWLPPLVRFTGMRAGRHLYFDHPSQPGQLVDITYELGDAVVRFLDVEPEDAEVTLLASDMSGTFERV